MLDALSAIMLPQVGSGGLMPIPRNDRDASSKSTFPTPSAADTMIGAAAFGRTWRKITRPLPVRIERRDEGRGERHDDQEGEDPEPPRGRAVAKEAAPPIVADGAVTQRPHQLGGRYQSDEQGEPVAERHAVRASTSAPTRTRSRGSASPKRMSARRLPPTTTVLATSAVAVTSE